MGCDICGRGSCTTAFHSIAEQERYEKVIEAFDHARELREQVRNEDQEDNEERSKLYKQN
jgi:transcription elongation factor Elf1